MRYEKAWKQRGDSVLQRSSSSSSRISDMDPGKSATAPLANWSQQPGEKSGVDPQPPPYQDYSAGYNPPPGVYPNQSGYPQPYGGAQQPYPGQQPFPGQQPYPGQFQGPYTDQPSVMVQPTVYVTSGPLAQPLPDYLGYSIFTMLCCCLPLGVAALVYSINTRTANRTGQRPLAESYSRLSRTLNHTALGIGIIVLTLYIIMVVIQVNNLQNHRSRYPY
ncbi:synapse differentiation-inducing gene protein 1-like isoform X3 [Astyanax mexicanus]|uniref:synapse differentiation-inducing gene protein 1-like isoform X3 n=1 Tax=Astyanax mexicanus TaxID=7994 RepID=UPI0020CB127A|nr:synapse differentiation-inducing gene protein 1-like isoform X3 [Astyanax mexicanus]